MIAAAMFLLLLLLNRSFRHKGREPGSQRARARHSKDGENNSEMEEEVFSRKS